MAKIIGNTTATPNPRPDWNQTDETKADYIKNKPTVLTEEVYSKKEIDNMMGDIETALDNIIAIQNTLIGGEGV